MSDPIDLTTYKAICEPIMTEIKATQKEHGEKLDVINAIVTNGLSHRVKRIERYIGIGVLGLFGYLAERILSHFLGGG